MTDFRTTPKDPDGNPVFSQNYKTISSDGYRKCGIKFIAAKGVVTVYDKLLTENIQLRGGWTWVSPEAVWGDEMYMSVVDKDDVLGLFATYGLTVGEDVLELTRCAQQDRTRASTTDPTSTLLVSTPCLNSGCNPKHSR